MTLYDILQVTEKAEKEVIASAYKGLVKKYHPDVSKSPDAERKMAEINNAYAVLSDPVKRSTYDQKLQSERNSFKNSSNSTHSTNYQNYNQGVKKEYVRPQPPKTEQSNPAGGSPGSAGQSQKVSQPGNNASSLDTKLLYLFGAIGSFIFAYLSFGSDGKTAAFAIFIGIVCLKRLFK